MEAIMNLLPLLLFYPKSLVREFFWFFYLRFLSSFKLYLKGNISTQQCGEHNNNYKHQQRFKPTLSFFTFH